MKDETPPLPPSPEKKKQNNNKSRITTHAITYKQSNPTENLSTHTN